MAKTRKVRFGRKVNNEESNRPWETIETNILLKIYKNIAPRDLLLRVSIVCRSWRSTFWDIILFPENCHTLDLTPMKHIVCDTFRSKYIFAYRKDYMKGIFRRKLKALVQSMLLNDNRILGGLEQRFITSIVIPTNMNLPSRNFILISQRTPSVKNLVLQDGFAISNYTCLAIVFKNWNSLSELSVGPIFGDHMAHVIRKLGMHCKNLQTLHMNMGMWKIPHMFMLHAKTSKSIVKRLKNLKEFRMTRVKLDEKAVEIILIGCEKLLTLNLHDCFVSLPPLGSACRRVDSVQITRKNVIATSESTTKWCIDDSEQEFLSSDQILDRVFSKFRNM